MISYFEGFKFVSWVQVPTNTMKSVIHFYTTPQIDKATIKNLNSFEILCQQAWSDL